MNRKLKKIPSGLCGLLLCTVFLISVRPYLFRDYWFDEALTLMNFAWLDDPLCIYSSYVIPNNQILYTIALHFWNRLPDTGLRPDFFTRLLSVVFALGTLLVLFRNFYRSCGRVPLMLALTALAVSPPFLIYGSALRGYMASAFFISLSAAWAVGFMKKGTAGTWWLFFAGCLMAVAAIPSNLLALGGCVLWAVSCGGDIFCQKKKIFLLCLTPFIALAAVYLPIWKSFAGVCRLGEGWQSASGVLTAYFCAAGAVSGLLWLPCVPAVWRRRHWIKKIRYLILILPAAAVAVLPTAPFPRVFFPLFPLLALLTAYGIRYIVACCVASGRKKMTGLVYCLCLCAVLLNVFLFEQPEVLRKISDRCGGASGDDFFLGYYMRPEHCPSQTASQLTGFFAPGKLPDVYLSFNADPWPLMYYMLSRGFQAEFLFDGPCGRVAALKNGTLIIINRSESAEAVSERFGVRLKFLFENPNHRVFIAE